MAARGHKWFAWVCAATLLLCVVWVALPYVDGPPKGFTVNDASAVGLLRTIHFLEEQRVATGYTCRFGDLTELPGANPNATASLLRSGYSFTFQDCVTAAQKRVTAYRVVAAPIELHRTGKFAFCESESGTIFIAKDGLAETCLSKGQELK